LLAVVKSAAKGTIIEPVVATICNLYPNIHPALCMTESPHLASVSIPERGTTPSVIDDLCHT